MMKKLRWFNISAPCLRVSFPGRREKVSIRPWNLFRRVSTDGHWWGFGVLQVEQRHLFLIGRTLGYPDAEVWMAGLCFVGLDDLRRAWWATWMRRNYAR